MDIDIEAIVKEYRPRLVAFLQTKRTAEDARVFAADCHNDNDMPTLFSIMSADAGHKTTYGGGGGELASAARKLTIGILRHPHNDFDLQTVLATFVAKLKMFKAKALGHSINRECEELDVNFWTKMWQDMEEGYYDGFMKYVLVLRVEMLQQCGSGGGDSGGNYSTDTVSQFFDMEYIKKNMYLRTYNFMSVFEFVRGFITHKIHEVFRPSFNAMCDNFVAEIPSTTTVTSNETTVRVLRFLVKTLLENTF